jgi:putative acetyltransferase
VSEPAGGLNGVVPRSDPAGTIMVRVRIEHRQTDDNGLATLLVAALDELTRRYPEYTGGHPLDPLTEFLIALVDDQPAGCVGMVPGTGQFAEMKRLYVDPAFRGVGIAQQLIFSLERRAVAAGFTQMRLETGIRQPEAIALYTRMGYQPAPPFDGGYEPNQVSRYFSKQLR